MMTRREQAKRLIEDYYTADDDIEYYNDIIRREAYDEDYPDEDACDSIINQLENEKSYLNSVWESDYCDLDWEELSNEVYGRVAQ